MAPDAPLTRLRSVGPIFRAQEAVGAGVSWRDLYRLRDGGAIIELSRGLYQLGEAAGVDNIDFISLSARAPLSMVCLHSALSHWDLSDEIPPQVHVLASAILLVAVGLMAMGAWRTIRRIAET